MIWDAEFEDKQRRKITFSVAGSVTAYHEGKRIGEFTLEVVEFDERFPSAVHAGTIDIDPARP